MMFLCMPISHKFPFFFMSFQRKLIKIDRINDWKPYLSMSYGSKFKKQNSHGVMLAPYLNFPSGDMICYWALFVRLITWYGDNSKPQDLM